MIFIKRIVSVFLTISFWSFLFAGNEFSKTSNIFVYFLLLCISVLIIALLKNIKQKKALEELLDNQEKFDNALLDTIPSPIFYKDTNRKYLGCNSSFCALVGLKKQEIIGQNYIPFFSEEWIKTSKENDFRLFNKQTMKPCEMTLHLPDGKMQHFVINKTYFENCSGEVDGIVGVIDDVTERFQQRQFIIQQNKLVEMGEIMAAVAHQWNEPLVELSAIIQDLEFSYKNGKLNEKEVNQFAKDSFVQIQYMSTTLKDFRDFLKPSVKKTVFNIRKSFDKLLDIIGRQILYSNIELKIAYKPEFGTINIFGYENEFMQVLLNILNNAKHKIVKSKIENRTIFIEVWQEYDSTFINIIDNAGAIDEKTIHKIFEPYFTTNDGGTGLGLYMAKVIIEGKMGGEITAYSTKNEAIFKIEVPSKPTNIDLE